MDVHPQRRQLQLLNHTACTLSESESQRASALPRAHLERDNAGALSAGVQVRWRSLIMPADVIRFRDLGGFSPIVKLTRGSDGVWRDVRDIRLDQ